ncbi:MAG: hypothetical protein Q9186_006801 [Xanthomendoza sp. 1 TL-2023]
MFTVTGTERAVGQTAENHCSICEPSLRPRDNKIVFWLSHGFEIYGTAEDCGGCSWRPQVPQCLIGLDRPLERKATFDRICERTGLMISGQIPVPEMPSPEFTSIRDALMLAVRPYELAHVPSHHEEAAQYYNYNLALTATLFFRVWIMRMMMGQIHAAQLFYDTLIRGPLSHPTQGPRNLHHDVLWDIFGSNIPPPLWDTATLYVITNEEKIRAYLHDNDRAKQGERWVQAPYQVFAANSVSWMGPNTNLAHSINRGKTPGPGFLTETSRAVPAGGQVHTDAKVAVSCSCTSAPDVRCGIV